MRPDRRQALLIAATLLAAVVLAAATHAAAQAPVAGRNQVRLSVLAHHPYPDKPLDQGGDPFGIPATNATGAPRDWMASHYDAYWFPTARFDGVLESSNQPDSAPRSFLDAYRRSLETRLAEDAPAAIRVEGAMNGSAAAVRATVMPLATVESDRVTLRLFVYEDDVAFRGENGVDIHRFVVRAMLPPAEVQLTRGEAVAVERAFQLGHGLDGAPWNPGRLGVVAYLENGDDAAPRLEMGEVLQSATYRFGQETPTVQAHKAVLLEMYTATWCDACVQGDGAMDHLAAEYGVASAVAEDAPWRYLRLPSAARAGVALLAAAAFVIALAPRRGRDAP